MLHAVATNEQTLGNCVKSFLLAKRVEGHSKKTLEWYGFLLGALEKNVSSATLVSSIDTNTLRRFLVDLEERGLSKSTIADHQRVTRTFFRWCVAEGLISNDPTLLIQKIRLPKQFPKIVPDEEVEKLLKACDSDRYEGIRNQAMILLFVDTGVRLMELIRFKPEDLNLLNRSLLVHQGKGGKSRIVFLGKRTTIALRKWLEIRHRPMDETLFCSRSGEPLKPRHVLSILQRLALKANLKAKVSPHRLRHTAATLMAKAGMNAFELAQLLGHSDVKTTMIYCHLGGMALQEAHAKASPVDRLLQ